MSRIVKFMERHAKAKGSGPFPWDRVFPSTQELELFGDELAEFCDGYQANVDELERLRAQIQSMQV